MSNLKEVKICDVCKKDTEESCWDSGIDTKTECSGADFVDENGEVAFVICSPCGNKEFWDAYGDAIFHLPRHKILELFETKKHLKRKRIHKNPKITFKEKQRRKMTNSLRFDVMNRDGFYCQLCGATGKDTQLVVDHILPVAKGGKTEFSNLQTLCFTCNSGKRDKA